MSKGNLKTEGNKGNNFPYQFNTLLALGAIEAAINGLPIGASYDSRTTAYEATNAGVGYGIGDILTRYDVISVPAGTLITTLWFNQSTQASITTPLPGDIISYAAALVIPSTTFVSTSVNSTGVGNIPVGARRGSVLNSGNSVGVWNSISLPAGVGIPFGGAGFNGTLSAPIPYDATGTRFIIEYDI